MQHSYIIGAKGVSFYGGYESFVQKLLEYQKDNKDICYHVACKANGEGSMDVSRLEGASEIVGGRFVYCNADCFLVRVPEWMRSAQAIAYDVSALKECCRHIEENKIEHSVVYILACRIGPFLHKYVKKIHQLGGKVYLNPDGHEWKRAKWPAPARKYWKESERMMVKEADLIICDSINIENYIQSEYKRYQPNTIYIAYGAETKESSLKDDDPQYVSWLKMHNVSSDYYTMIGRCVPENNFETIIREFMMSNTTKDLVIITTNNQKFLDEMDRKLHYRKDRRIKFVGTVYDQELLTKIREKAYGYIHGHSVGGTNPSLLEALGSTKLNLLYAVGFNKEVAQNAALYWTKEDRNLADLIDEVDQMTVDRINEYGQKAKERISKAYSWENIVKRYEEVFFASL